MNKKFPVVIATKGFTIFVTLTFTDETYKDVANTLEIVSYCPLTIQVNPETSNESVNVETCTLVQVIFANEYCIGKVITTVLDEGTSSVLYAVGLRSGRVALSAVKV